MTDPASNRELPDHLETASGPGGGVSNRATYPLPRPPEGDDHRFTFGLMLDVGDVLAKHGYPKVAGRDAVALMRRLFDFIYEEPAEDPLDDSTTKDER